MAAERPPSYALALDLESVLVPEIWGAVATRHNIPELTRCTRDDPDYGRLMRSRVMLCREHGITMTALRAVVSDLEPLPGALDFLAWARAVLPVVIVSDTFYELAAPLLSALGSPLCLCHRLHIDAHDLISSVHIRQKHAKLTSVRALQSLAFRVVAVGDSYNDLEMLYQADVGLLLDPPPDLATEHHALSCVRSLCDVREHLDALGAVP